ncbi:restriction system-associated AAA family ATPase [Flavobacterium columnare]|uniref:restriction system-associated AAA family ATPase n=1 Tax=Flavobacterium columnare TaxID=996 RepID=UPI002D204665|nr:restriction system-associated AAA family ATPase [Flavobacterium columnare]MEB3800471.1 restriction system-associated AAA family ATPase [Flavobacterium columnare]
MKLLKFEIGKLPKEKQFRSLHSGFKIEFHKLYVDEKQNELDENGILTMDNFNPFCLAGLNGSGKSNVLEALANIFFNLESCVAKFKPKTFEKHFRTDECNPDAYTLEYLIGQHDGSIYSLSNYDKITIIKEEGKSPKMYKQSFPFTKNEKRISISLKPRYDKQFPEPAEGKSYLPDIVVGYSSGENEILSLPFRKSRLINFDKYKEDYRKGYLFEEPENSLIYIDNEMSQAVLLACLLYENENTLKPLRDELGILELRSFRMTLNINPLLYEDDINVPILQHITDKIEILKKCASSWFLSKNEEKIDYYDTFPTLTLDFKVTKETKFLFKEHFKTSFDLFRFFQVLYELNSNVISEDIKEDVYKSSGFYTDWKIPKSSPGHDIFHFEDFFVLKLINDEEKPLLLREFSDGEHQFLHTMGICLMLKERRSLLLLDEPETHFNPSWRAKFIKILEDSITTGNNRDYLNGRFNVHALKDILLTSHSPFIISDCMPDNVIFFSKNQDLLEAKKASQLGFKTYGSSVDYILKNFFKTDLISNKSRSELIEVIDSGNIQEHQSAIEKFGESSTKQFLYKKIYKKLNLEDDNNSDT